MLNIAKPFLPAVVNHIFSIYHIKSYKFIQMSHNDGNLIDTRYFEASICLMNEIEFCVISPFTRNRLNGVSFNCHNYIEIIKAFYT